MYWHVGCLLCNGKKIILNPKTTTIYCFYSKQILSINPGERSRTYTKLMQYHRPKMIAKFLHYRPSTETANIITFRIHYIFYSHFEPARFSASGCISCVSVCVCLILCNTVTFYPLENNRENSLPLHINFQYKLIL